MKTTCLNLVAFYIDPGSGALAWQALVCALLGCLFYVRRSLSSLFGLLKRKHVPLHLGGNGEEPVKITGLRKS